MVYTGSFSFGVHIGLFMLSRALLLVVCVHIGDAALSAELKLHLSGAGCQVLVSLLSDVSRQLFRGDAMELLVVYEYFGR